MLFRSLALFATLVLAGSGAAYAGAETEAQGEECPGFCRYSHALYSGAMFEPVWGACSIADCFPIPAHNHGVGSNWGIKSIDPAAGFQTGNKSGEQGQLALDHRHDLTEHGHDHPHAYSGVAVPAGADHHHGKRLDDQMVILLDHTTGEVHFINPASMKQDVKTDATEDDLIGYSWEQLQSAHVVDYCVPGEGCDTN